MNAYERVALLVGKIGFSKVRVSLLLVTVAICAYFLAKGTTTLINLSLMAATGNPPKVVAQKQQTKRSVYPGSDSPNANEILQRNIFDSKTGPLWPQQELNDSENDAAAPEEIPVPGPDDPPPECEQKLFLVAAAYFPNNPNRSMVALEGPTELDTQPLYRQGTKIGEFDLVAIYPDIAYLKKPTGDYCSLKLYSQRRPERKTERKAKPRKSRRQKLIERTKKRWKKNKRKKNKRKK